MRLTDGHQNLFHVLGFKNVVADAGSSLKMFLTSHSLVSVCAGVGRWKDTCVGIGG